MLALLLAACPGGDKSSPSDSRSTPDTSTQASCVGTGFTPGVEAWSLPAGYPSGTFDSPTDAGGDRSTWAVFDIDGNGGADLVFAQTEGAEDVGRSRWLAYLNSGNGFGPAGTDWELPSGFADGAFTSFGEDSGGLAWGLIDMNADGAADLVVARSDTAPDVGTEHWLVYFNSGGRFGPAATEWALPGGFAAATFDGLADGALGDVTWALLDIDGSGVPDLIVTETEAAADVGRSHWLAYLDGADGFGPAATQWGLPDGYADGAFDHAYDVEDDDTRWGLLDVDGGGR